MNTPLDPPQPPAPPAPPASPPRSRRLAVVLGIVGLVAALAIAAEVVVLTTGDDGPGSSAAPSSTASPSGTPTADPTSEAEDEEDDDGAPEGPAWNAINDPAGHAVVRAGTRYVRAYATLSNRSFDRSFGYMESHSTGSVADDLEEQGEEIEDIFDDIAVDSYAGEVGLHDLTGTTAELVAVTSVDLRPFGGATSETRHVSQRLLLGAELVDGEWMVSTFTEVPDVRAVPTVALDSGAPIPTAISHIGTMLYFGADEPRFAYKTRADFATRAYRRAYFDWVEAAVLPPLRRSGTSVYASVGAPAVVAASDDRIELLICVDNYVTAATGKRKPQLVGYSARLTLALVDGQWLIDGFEPFDLTGSFGDPTGATA